MTAALDGIFRPLAVNLISKFGTAAVLLRRTSLFSPTNGKVTTVDASHAVIITPPAPLKHERRGADLKSQTSGQALYMEGDMECMVAAQGLPVVPSPLTDHVVHAGKEWHLISVGKVYSGDLISAYKLHLRE